MAALRKDYHFMEIALKLAKRAEGFTSPNPLVGAVIAKNNKMISSGYHKRAGLAHAEIEAMRKAKVDLKGATLYVNLEPCVHFGRTPPCVDEIIRSQIKRVVIATPDPNPLVFGKSIRRLRKAGIKVDVGISKKGAQRLNEVFFKNMRHKKPFVAVKIAQSLDGRIATKNGLSKWITEEASRYYAKSLRDRYDCVLVGINTVMADRPRLEGFKKAPYKAVLDPGLKISLKLPFFKKNADRLIIFTSFASKKRAKILPRCVKIFFIKKKGERFILKEILNNLYKIGVMSVFVEGGAETIGRFFDEKLADKIYFFIAPKIVGGKGLSSVKGEGFSLPNRCPLIKDIKIKKIGEDILVTGYPHYE